MFVLNEAGSNFKPDPTLSYYKLSKQWRDYYLDFLIKQGYPKFAQLLAVTKYDITNDPRSIGYTTRDRKKRNKNISDINYDSPASIMAGATIVTNPAIADDVASAVIRHEICHNYFAHELVMMRYLGESVYNVFARQKRIHELMNIAMDYDISNRMYTDKDKQILQHIEICGRIVSGLVTELDHPDWLNLTMVEMYEKLMEEEKQKKQQAKQQQSQQGQGQNDSDDNQGDDDQSDEGQGGGSGDDQDDDQSDDNSDDAQSGGSGGEDSDDGESDGDDGEQGGGGSGSSKSNDTYDDDYRRGWEQAMKDFEDGVLQI